MSCLKLYYCICTVTGEVTGTQTSAHRPTSQAALHASAYSQLILYHEMTRSISTPHGWNANPSQGYPPALNLLLPIYTPSGWGEKLGKLSVLTKCKTQSYVSNQGSNPGCLIQSEHTNHEATASPHTCHRTAAGSQTAAIWCYYAMFPLGKDEGALHDCL